MKKKKPSIIFSIYDLMQLTISLLGRKKKARGLRLFVNIMFLLRTKYFKEKPVEFFFQVMQKYRPLLLLKKSRRGSHTIDIPIMVSEQKAYYFALQWIIQTINVSDTAKFAETIFALHKEDLSCEAYRLSIEYLEKCQKSLVHIRQSSKTNKYSKYQNNKVKRMLEKDYKLYHK
jgi:ribosomal protein S7